MGKLTRIFIVQHSGIEHHWWHRLANVLIYGSTALVLIGLLSYEVFSVSHTSEVYTYSFQPNYVSARGRESACTFFDELGNSYTPPVHYTDTGFNPSRFTQISLSPFHRSSLWETLVVCGDIHDSTELINLLEKYQPNTDITDAIAGLRACGHGGGCFGSNDEAVTNALIDNGSLAGIKVKTSTTFDYSGLAVAMVSVIALASIWFIILESVIYRTIIYIVYGRKN